MATDVQKSRSLKLAKRRYATVRLVLVAVFVALIAVGAFIKFPIGIVPVSLQCAMCLVCALMLGAKDATVAVVIYVAMGLVGIPIFTAGGGFAYVLQPTFGYLLGYIFAVPAGALIARGARNTSRPRLARLLLGALVFLAILYTFGVIYMYLMLNFYVGKTVLMSNAWLTGCAVFLPTDCAFAIIASVVAYKVIPLVFRKSEGMFGLRADLVKEEYLYNPCDTPEQD